MQKDKGDKNDARNMGFDYEVPGIEGTIHGRGAEKNEGRLGTLSKARIATVHEKTTGNGNPKGGQILITESSVRRLS